jgi:hypothetical protein
VTVGLTPSTTYAYYLFACDAYSRYSSIYGLGNKSSKAVIAALQKYATDGTSTANFEYVNLDCICADTGSQFTSQAFLQHCIEGIRAEGAYRGTLLGTFWYGT